MIKLRKKEYMVPRDNVIFELGLFMGRLGPDRTFMVIPRGTKVKDMHLPTDLLGITTADYDPDRYDKNWLAALGPACNKIRRQIDNKGLFKLSVPPSIPKLEHLNQLEEVEKVNTYVGPWSTIHIQGIQKLAQSDKVTNIDVLAAYRIGEIRRVLDSFRKNPDANLRVCFANMWDNELAKAYQRKYFDREIKYLQNAVEDSIIKLLGKCEIQVSSPTEIIISDIETPPLAKYDIRLTAQRITFSYYRIQNTSFIVPLDMKKTQNPPPMAWVLNNDSTPGVFDNYSKEYDEMFNESYQIYFNK